MVQSQRLSCAALVTAVVGSTAAWTFVPPLSRAAQATSPQREMANHASLREDLADAASPAISGVEFYDPWFMQATRWIGSGVVIGLLAVAFSSTPVEAYNTPLSGQPTWEQNIAKGSVTPVDYRSKLEPCKQSKKYAKRIKDSLYKIKTRQDKYPEGSVVYNRFVEKTARIKARQAAYGERLCGKKDGLPRVLADNSIKGGVLLPSLVFLYITGWIGWVGRDYLRKTRSIEKELNMDVPLALTCMASGFAWPVLGWQAIVNGKMAVNDYDLYRSGR